MPFSALGVLAAGVAVDQDCSSHIANSTSSRLLRCTLHFRKGSFVSFCGYGAHDRSTPIRHQSAGIALNDDPNSSPNSRGESLLSEEFSLQNALEFPVQLCREFNCKPLNFRAVSA
jgi:hypothetical protein